VVRGERDVLRVDAVRHQKIAVEDFAFLPRVLHLHFGIVLMADDAELGGVLKDDCVACLL
jgi:hypothetical protein